MSVSLSPLEMKVCFHPTYLCSNLSITGSHVFISLKSAPKGKPKYLIGKLTSLHPKALTKSSDSLFVLNLTISDLDRLILSPKTVWNHIKHI